jgi:hypothetical protein
MQEFGDCFAVILIMLTLQDVSSTSTQGTVILAKTYRDSCYNLPSSLLQLTVFLATTYRLPCYNLPSSLLKLTVFLAKTYRHPCYILSSSLRRQGPTTMGIKPKKVPSFDGMTSLSDDSCGLVFTAPVGLYSRQLRACTYG